MYESIENHRTVIELDAKEFRLVDVTVLFGEGEPPFPGCHRLETYRIVAVDDAMTGERYLPYLSHYQIEALEREVWECRRYDDEQFYIHLDPWPEHPPIACRDYH